MQDGARQGCPWRRIDRIDARIHVRRSGARNGQSVGSERSRHVGADGAALSRHVGQATIIARSGSSRVPVVAMAREALERALFLGRIHAARGAALSLTTDLSELNNAR